MSQESFNWKNISDNTLSALRYQCQQKRIHPTPTSKSDMVAALQDYRNKNPVSPINSATSSSSSSRQMTPINFSESEMIRKAKQNKMTIYQFIHTPNPIVLTAALVCSCVAILVLFVFLISSK